MTDSKFTQGRARAGGAGTNRTTTRRKGRKERELGHIRRDILDAAARAFARRGFHGTTMEDVAREAGYAVGSLYTYFEGKEALYGTLLQRIADEMEAIVERPMPSSLDFRQRFETQMIQLFELVERNRDLLLTFLSHRASFNVGGTGRPEGELVRDIYMRQVERMAARAAEAMKQGALRRVAARDVAYFAVDAGYGAVLRWASGDLKGSLVDHAPVLSRLIFDGIGAKKEKRS
jgi:AcrR family transcriptional regulator